MSPGCNGLKALGTLGEDLSHTQELKFGRRGEHHFIHKVPRGGETHLRSEMMLAPSAKLQPVFSDGIDLAPGLQGLSAPCALG